MAYTYQADIYCDDCGRAIRRRIESERAAPETPSDETSFDSNEYPKCVQNDEADNPNHCAACNVFLENELTEHGKQYVLDMIRQAILAERPYTETEKEWFDYYSFTLSDLIEHHDTNPKWCGPAKPR